MYFHIYNKRLGYSQYVTTDHAKALWVLDNWSESRDGEEGNYRLITSNDPDLDFRTLYF